MQSLTERKNKIKWTALVLIAFCFALFIHASAKAEEHDTRQGRWLQNIDGQGSFFVPYVDEGDSDPSLATEARNRNAEPRTPRPRGNGTVMLPGSSTRVTNRLCGGHPLCEGLSGLSFFEDIPRTPPVASARIREVAEILLVILLTAGVAVNLAQSVAISIATAIQSGVDLTADDIAEIYHRAQRADRSLAPDSGSGFDDQGGATDTDVRHVPPSPIYDPSTNQPFEMDEDGRYLVSDGKGGTHWVSRDQARESVSVLRDKARQHRASLSTGYSDAGRFSEEQKPERMSEEVDSSQGVSPDYAYGAEQASESLSQESESMYADAEPKQEFFSDNGSEVSGDESAEKPINSSADEIANLRSQAADDARSRLEGILAVEPQVADVPQNVSMHDNGDQMDAALGSTPELDSHREDAAETARQRLEGLLGERSSENENIGVDPYADLVHATQSPIDDLGNADSETDQSPSERAEELERFRAHDRWMAEQREIGRERRAEDDLQREQEVSSERERQRLIALGRSLSNIVSDPVKAQQLEDFLERHTEDRGELDRALEAIRNQTYETQQQLNQGEFEQAQAEGDALGESAEFAESIRDNSRRVNRVLGRVVPGGERILAAQDVLYGAVEDFDRDGLRGVAGGIVTNAIDDRTHGGASAVRDGFEQGKPGESATERAQRMAEHWVQNATEDKNPLEIARRAANARSAAELMDVGLDILDVRDDFQEGGEASEHSEYDTVTPNPNQGLPSSTRTGELDKAQRGDTPQMAQNAGDNLTRSPEDTSGEHIIHVREEMDRMREARGESPPVTPSPRDKTEEIAYTEAEHRRSQSELWEAEKKAEQLREKTEQLRRDAERNPKNDDLDTEYLSSQIDTEITEGKVGSVAKREMEARTNARDTYDSIRSDKDSTNSLDGVDDGVTPRDRAEEIPHTVVEPLDNDGEDVFKSEKPRGIETPIEEARRKVDDTREALSDKTLSFSERRRLLERLRTQEIIEKSRNRVKIVDGEWQTDERLPTSIQRESDASDGAHLGVKTLNGEVSNSPTRLSEVETHRGGGIYKDEKPPVTDDSTTGGHTQEDPKIQMLNEKQQRYREMRQRAMTEFGLRADDPVIKDIDKHIANVDEEILKQTVPPKSSSRTEGLEELDAMEGVSRHTSATSNEAILRRKNWGGRYDITVKPSGDIEVKSLAASSVADVDVQKAEGDWQIRVNKEKNTYSIESMGKGNVEDVIHGIEAELGIELKPYQSYKHKGDFGGVELEIQDPKVTYDLNDNGDTKS